jgi:hypothetical protein
MKMKILLKLTFVAAVVTVCLMAAPRAQAGDVADRVYVQLATGTGASTWTNTFQYSSVDLKRIWIQRNLVATDTCTVTRVTSDNLYTDAVGTVAISTSKGNTASFTAEYLKYGDMIPFANTSGTGGVAVIDLIVSKH